MSITVGFFLYSPFPALSVASATEFLRIVNAIAGRELYSWRFFTPDGAEPISAARLTAHVDGTPDTADVDVLIVCATNSAMQCRDARLFAELRRIARRGTLIGGMSGGPVLLARAGLLTGRRCTAHWDHLPALREEFPDLDVRTTLYEVDGSRFTCAGGNAALDMMNALISADHGPEIAKSASDILLQTTIRHGEHAQRMAVRDRLEVAHPVLIKAIQRLETDLSKPLDRQKLATSVNLSLRQLERLFKEKLHTTINSFHMKLRLDKSRSLIKQSSLPLSEIAIATGFVNFSHFSRLYKQAFGESPRVSRNAPNSR